ncbi:MAG: NAD(P)/FAD-dependent oxidoreductase, partial [Oscillospiraceae bacterium]
MVKIMAENRRIIVVGGGASGMIAAGFAASRGFNVKLIEKNKILGKKLMITGKGRCNITNACDKVEELIKNIPTNGSFLYSAFYNFTNQQTIEFFNNLGVDTKVERGNRVFPVSDKSLDVVNALRDFMIQNNVEIITDTVQNILVDGDKVSGVVTQKRGVITADDVIIATGGMSYTLTGSTGDGYEWAKKLGHTITEIKPSLVPIEVEEKWVSGLKGVSLKNVEVKVIDEKNKKIHSEFGEMMFAHFGLTGPIILSTSSHIKDLKGKNYRIILDLKPALDEKQLDARVLRDFQKYNNKDFRNSLGDLLPSSLIDVIIGLAEIDPFKKVNSVTKEERARLVFLLKNLELHITGFSPIEQAIITSGGVCVKEINPSTMQSKLVNGLYFCGEIIDVDGYTGGFNLQIAFSTGFLAG